MSCYFFFAGFLVFINLYSVKYGAIALQEIFDDIQPKQVVNFLVVKHVIFGYFIRLFLIIKLVNCDAFKVIVTEFVTF